MMESPGGCRCGLLVVLQDFRKMAVVDPVVSSEDRPARGVLSRGLMRILIGGVTLYRMTLQSWLGGHCRFEPSCSQYFIEAVEKHGPMQGAFKGIWRICRCQPFCRGGYDPP